MIPFGRPQMRFPIGGPPVNPNPFAGQMPERPFMPAPVMPRQNFPVQMPGGGPPVAPGGPFYGQFGGGAPAPVGLPPVNSNPWGGGGFPARFGGPIAPGEPGQPMNLYNLLRSMRGML